MGVSAVDHLNSSPQPQPGETPCPGLWTIQPVSHGVGAQRPCLLTAGAGKVKLEVQSSCHEWTSFARNLSDNAQVAVCDHTCSTWNNRVQAG